MNGFFSYGAERRSEGSGGRGGLSQLVSVLINYDGVCRTASGFAWDYYKTKRGRPC